MKVHTPASVRRPAPIDDAFCVLISMLLLLCVRYDWSPIGKNLDDGGKFELILVSAIILLPSALAWLLRTCVFLGRERVWSWKILLAPALVLLATVFAVVPGPTTFEDERSSFDRLAHQVQANPGGTYANIHMGSIDIKAARQRADNAIYFYDADANTSFAGWVYSPDRRPTYYNFTTLNDLGDGWYKFAADG